MLKKNDFGVAQFVYEFINWLMGEKAFTETLSVIIARIIISVQNYFLLVCVTLDVHRESWRRCHLR